MQQWNNERDNKARNKEMLQSAIKTQNKNLLQHHAEAELRRLREKRFHMERQKIVELIP